VEHPGVATEDFPAKWNPVSRKKMRLTNRCEYGRECAAGQPGAGGFFEGPGKSTGKPPQAIAMMSFTGLV